MIGICLVTYNQEKYIIQCIESALKQICSEPYTLYIGEDKSLDNTCALCKKYANEYPDKIKLFAREYNLGLVQNTIDLLYRIKNDGCDYIAMLDGDDYWIDENKLEKQISFLKKNTDYGLVHTNVHLLLNNKIKNNKRNGIVEGDVFQYIGTKCISIANCTCLFRTELLNYCVLDDFISHHFLSIDYVMYVIFAKYTKFGFLDDFTAVWRRGHNSISYTHDVSKQIAYLTNDDRMWQYLSMKFPERFKYNEIDARDYYNWRCFQIAFREGDWKRARKAMNEGFSKNNLKVKFKKMIVLILDMFTL